MKLFSISCTTSATYSNGVDIGIRLYTVRDNDSLVTQIRVHNNLPTRH